MLNKLVCKILMFVLVAAMSGTAQQHPISLKAARTMVELKEKHMDKAASDLLYSILHRSSEFSELAATWQLLGDLHSQRNRHLHAFMAYYTVLHFDIVETQRSDLRVAAKMLTEKSKALVPIKEKLSSLVDKARGEGDASQRELAAIHSLQALEYPKLYPAIIEVARFYAHKLPFAVEVPALWLSISEMEAAQKHYWEALAAALMVVKDYSETEEASLASLRMAGLYAENLKKYDRAAVVYLDIINTEADSMLHADARWAVADLRDHRQKSYSAAVESYNECVENHPGDERIGEAWMRIGQIQIDKLKQPEAGVDAYTRFIELAPTHVLVSEARLAIGRTYEKKMKDYAKAIDAYAAFATEHKDHELAAITLLKAGKLAKDKLKDDAKAIEIFQYIIDNYTTQEPADQARKYFKKLNGK
ncbi:tetratricopeptide repeat protein [bacterium]|nr:tetratricopeptide repeat protein [bacterium]